MSYFARVNTFVSCFVLSKMMFYIQKECKKYISKIIVSRDNVKMYTKTNMTCKKLYIKSHILILKNIKVFDFPRVNTFFI